MADREIAFASVDSNTRNTLARLTTADPHLWIGASERQLASVTEPLPATGLEAPAEPTSAIAGMRFAEPITWQFNAGAFILPAGTRITRLPDSGDFRIRGDGVVLPNQTVLHSGSVRAVAGKVTLDNSAVVSSDGVPFRARAEDAQLRGSNHIMAAGPHVTMALPELDPTTGLPPGVTPAPATPPDAPQADTPDAPQADAPDAPDAPQADAPQARPDLRQQRIRFTVNEALLPGGTEVRRGTGTAVALYDGDQAVGVVAGSVEMHPGALLYTRADYRGDPKELVDRTGPRGQVSRGAVVHKDGLIIGVQTSSRVVLDGAEF
jgi:hypothetical protein